MQADRLGEDITVPGAASASQGRRAPLMTSIDGDFNIMVGLIANFTAAAGGGREITEFEDYNGDGLPDIRSGTQIDVTGPRGALAGRVDIGEDAFDTSLALGGGLSGSAIAISPKSTSGASKGGGKAAPTSKKTSRGMNVGLGFDLGAEWTNPIADGEAQASTSGHGDKNTITSDVADSREGLTPAGGASGTIFERAMEDMNGDGLPDRVDTYSSGEIWVNLNLGYRFANKAVQWSTGRLSYEKSVTGNLSVGFQFDAYEFAGGIAYSESVGYGLFGWEDIDGDGVPDRTSKVRGGGEGDPRTVFGSADGMGRTEVDFGNYFHGDVRVDANKEDTTLADDNGNMNGVSLPGGQTSVSRSTALTGGVDFSIYIGPICLVACYVVINPGVHGGYTRSTDQVQLTDVNGDGYPDSVRSTSDNDLQVRLNQHGRTEPAEVGDQPARRAVPPRLRADRQHHDQPRVCVGHEERGDGRRTLRRRRRRAEVDLRLLRCRLRPGPARAARLQLGDREAARCRRQHPALLRAHLSQCQPVRRGLARPRVHQGRHRHARAGPALHLCAPRRRSSQQRVRLRRGRGRAPRAWAPRTGSTCSTTRWTRC